MSTGINQWRKDYERYAQNRLRHWDGDVHATRPQPANGPGFTCRFCGHTVDELSDDEDERAYELKWQVHWKCRELIEDYLDEFTSHPALRSFGHLVKDDQ